MASMDNVRMVLIHNCAVSVSVARSAIGVLLMFHLHVLVLLADSLAFERPDLSQTAQMAWSLAELGLQKRYDEIPRDGRSHRTPAHTDNIHVVVFDALPGREVVMHQPGANGWYLVCADRRADAAAADRHPALDRPRRHSASERDDEVGIIVARV